MDTVLKLLEELEEILESSRAMPFSNKVSVDREEIFELITEIRLRFPAEMKQAKWVLEERNKILIDAQSEAEELIRNAEERFQKMVDEHEITKKAYEQAAEIIENGKSTAKEMRLGAIEYADQILTQLDQRVREALDVMREQSMNTENFFTETLEIIYNNRMELKDSGSQK